jgi:Na+/H+ antiporter NhaC
LEENIESLNRFIPAVLFAVSFLLAFSTGTSWGTFGVLLPVVVPIMPVGSEILIISISSCLAGAVCGDHCSPISDTTIMASTGAQCSHLEHVATQLPYVLFVAAFSFVGYIAAGFVQSVAVLPVLATLLVAALVMYKKFILEKK